jgi:hypothetical protein
MRLSKTAWIVLGVGIFVIVAATLGWLYFNERGKQRELNDSLAEAEGILSPLIVENKDWQNQLNDLQSQLSYTNTLLNMSMADFSLSVESTDVDEKLFEIADSLELEIKSIISSEPTDEDIEGIIYSITPFVVTVEGEQIADPGFAAVSAYELYIDETVNKIVNFVSSLAISEYFSNATIELLTLEVPSLLTEEQLESQSAEVERPLATVRLSFYSYQSEGE